MQLPRNVYDGKGDHHAHPMVTGDTTLTVEALQFAYQLDGGLTKHVIKGVSFSLPPGKHMAILGRSGQGKSTLLKLMGRMYQPDEGEIRVGGVNVNGLYLPEMITTMQQDCILFGGTIAENIALGSKVQSSGAGGEQLNMRDCTCDLRLSAGDLFPLRCGSSFWHVSRYLPSV